MSWGKPQATPVVTPDEVGPNVWRVNKPVVDLKPGETVTFDPGGMAARLWIPARGLFEEVAEVTQLDCEPVTLRISEEAGDGYYPYGLFLMGKNIMVEGNSPPYIRIMRSTPSRGGGG